MIRARVIVALVAVVGLLSSCAGESIETSGPSPATSTVVAANTSTTTTQAPDGPCLDGADRLVVEPSVYVAAEAPSFGYAKYPHCPWIETTRPGMAADGFLHDLEQVRIEVQPSERISIDAPGYPGADLSASWTIRLTSEPSAAALTTGGAGHWEVVAPDRPAVYTLYLGLTWPTGNASYGVTAVVGDVTGNLDLVSVTPDHDVEIHPTLLPGNLVACEPGEAALRFCDPDADYVWLELYVRRAESLDFGRAYPDDLLPGVLRSEGPWPESVGIMLSAGEILTAASSGIEFDTVNEILASIPAFDSDARGVACAHVDPAELVDYTWMCDLAVSTSGEMVESDLHALADVVGDQAVLYQFEPVLPGTSMTGWALVYPRETLDDELAAWRSQAIDAAEELGYDPTLVDDPGSQFTDVAVQPQPALAVGVWAEIVAGLEEAGFDLEVVLRRGQWYGDGYRPVY